VVLLISYDLNRGERPSSYTAVRQMIERHAPGNAHMKVLYSQWFVHTRDDPNTWHARMKTVADDDDNWFICVVREPKQGWLPKATWEWLNAESRS
jgi:hypothetical protein